MKKILLFACVLVVLSSYGQNDKSKIDARDLKTFVKVLTSESFAGRGTGTEGQKKAERFIYERFESLGLDTRLEKFKLVQTYWGEVYIKTPAGTLENFENMVFRGHDEENEETEKEVVFGGWGTDEELNQIDIQGKLVLVFVKNLRSDYEINARLKDRKASGVILANPDNERQFESIKNTFRDYALQKRLSWPRDSPAAPVPLKWDTIRSINTVLIPNSEVKSITGLSLRELNKVMDAKRLQDVPSMKVKIKFQKVEREIKTANVIGVIKGASDTSIVISAHYDHLGNSGKQYFPGADDNASGTAALLEMAEEFSIGQKGLKYSIVFLATSAEEGGLLGSYYHVNQPDFKTSTILCNLNVDMIARKDDQHGNKKYLYCMGMGQSKKLDAAIKKADSLYRDCTLDYSLDNHRDPAGLFTRSDNYNFYRKGIPAILFFSGLHTDYHQTTDTWEKIDFENLEKRVRLVSLSIELLQGKSEN